MIWILLRVSSRQSLNVWWWGLPVWRGASSVIMSVCMKMCFCTCWAFRVSTLSLSLSCCLFFITYSFSPLFVFLLPRFHSFSFFSVSFSMLPTSSFILSLFLFSPLCHVISVAVCFAHFFSPRLCHSLSLPYLYLSPSLFIYLFLSRRIVPT